LNSASNLKLLKDSAALPFLKALEVSFDLLTNSARKATLFERSTVRAGARLEMTSGDVDPVQRAREALLLSLDHCGVHDLQYAAARGGCYGEAWWGGIASLYQCIPRTSNALSPARYRARLGALRGL
jgi:hypothetical protein